MTKLEKFQEVVITKRNPSPFMKVCYWCGKEFYHQGTVFNNIHFDPKIFCSKQCRDEWIYIEQSFGVRRLE